MKHLHFVQALDPLRGGGMGAAALDLHRAFLDLDVESALISTRSPNEAAVDVPGVVQFVRRGVDKAFFVPDLRSMVSPLVAHAEVIHAHGFYVDVNRVIGGLAISLDKPVVSHVHGIFEPWILERSRVKKGIVHRLFENRNFGYAKLWRALTEREAGQIRSVGIDAPIVVAPNGVDPVDFETSGLRSVPQSDGERCLLFLGRIHPKKGLDVLLPALASLGSRFDGWHLIVAGPDEGGYEATVRTLIRDLDLGDRVRLVGAVRGDDKFALLRSADAFVLPSYSEGFPVTVLEAMASGCPVVVTRASNVNGIEAHGAGISCDATVASLEEALMRLVDLDDTERDAMGQRGRLWVQEKFTWPSIAQTILDACERELV